MAQKVYELCMISSTLLTRFPSIAPCRFMLIAPRPLPLYVRIQEKLAREIAAGHWKDGERFPTEQELSVTLNAAVGTIRKAVAALVAQGVLVKRQGSGTYVRVATRNRTGTQSIYEFLHLELTGGGGLPGASMLDFRLCKRPRAAPRLGPDSPEIADRPYYRLRRLRLLDEVPMALEEIWFDSRHAPELRAQDLGEALYHFYEHALGFWIASVQDQVSTGRVPNWAPPEFALPPDTPCGWIARRAFAANGQTEETSQTWFNPALAHYSARWP
jgi:GntR family transcriptional regulator